MQDNRTPSTPDIESAPIEGELTDEDLKQVSGGHSPWYPTNTTGVATAIPVPSKPEHGHCH